MEDVEKHNQNNTEILKTLVNLTKNYNSWINDEIKKTKEGCTRVLCMIVAGSPDTCLRAYTRATFLVAC